MGAFVMVSEEAHFQIAATDGAHAGRLSSRGVAKKTLASEAKERFASLPLCHLPNPATVKSLALLGDGKQLGGRVGRGLNVGYQTPGGGGEAVRPGRRRQHAQETQQPHSARREGRLLRADATKQCGEANPRS